MRSAESTRRTNRKTGARGLAGLALLLTLAVVSVSTGCGGDEAEHRAVEERTPVAVETTPAVEQDWSDGVEVTASVQPLYRAMPSTVLMGRVDEILRQEGDRVREGQVLARVDSTDVTAKVAQAEAGVAAAQAMKQNAGLMKERMERLHSRDAATQKDLDDASAGYEAALANLRAAEEGVKAARSYLAYSEIKAPFGGVVVDRMVEVGDMAAPGRPLFVIEDTSRVKIEGQVPESAAAGLSKGDRVEVEIGGERFEAELSELLPAADPRSRTFTVRALLDNPGGRLRSGMFARLRLGGDGSPAVTVPEDSVVRRGPLTGIFVVEDDSTARLRWIALGRTRDGLAEILTGLAPGEPVVLRPGHEVEDGRPVEVR